MLPILLLMQHACLLVPQPIQKQPILFILRLILPPQPYLLFLCTAYPAQSAAYPSRPVTDHASLFAYPTYHAAYPARPATDPASLLVCPTHNAAYPDPPVACPARPEAYPVHPITHVSSACKLRARRTEYKSVFFHTT